MTPTRTLLKNIFSLTVAEAANKGITFIFYAYLARVLQPEGFGLIGYANAFLAYFGFIVNLGFGSVGAREIAKSKDLISKYTNNIVTIRTILAVLTYFILFFTTLFLDKPLEYKYVIWIAGFNLFSYSILMDWFFQGVERMEFLALRQVIISVLNLLGIVLLVHSRQDTVLAMLVITVSAILNSIWLLGVYIKLYGPIKIEIDLSFFKGLLKSSIPIAFFNISVTVLNTLNMLLLGEFHGTKEVGIYSAGFKILMITYIPSTILMNAFFPILSRANSLEEKINTQKKYATALYFIGAIVGVCVFVFPNFFVNTIFGGDYSNTINLLRFLMLTSIIVCVNNTITPALIAWQREKNVMIAIIIGSIVNIVLNFIAIPKYSFNGAAIATIFSELTVCIGLTYFLFKEIKRISAAYYIKFLLFAVVSGLIAYGLNLLFIPDIFSLILMIVLYILLNIFFKTISLKELKGYLKK